MKLPTLFATLKKVREFERMELPFIRTLIDFDIIIDVGLAQEERRSITPKQLFLLKIGSITTVRRRLAALVEKGIIRRRRNAHDHRSDVLTVAPATLRVLDRYAAALAAMSPPPK